jgi:dihydrofolate reductase
VSLDGRISTSPDLPPNQERRGGWTSPEDKTEFMKAVNDCQTVVMGRKTFELTPNLWKPTYVVTHSPDRLRRCDGVIPPNDQALRNWLESQSDRKVLLCGGARTNALFLQYDLVDEVQLTLEPVVLNTGPTMGFDGLFNVHTGLVKFKLAHCLEINSAGTVSLLYKRK